MVRLTCPVASCPLWKKDRCKHSTEYAKIHKFPIDEQMKLLWENFVSKANGIQFKGTRYHGLCSSHFAGKFILPSGRVTKDAIPNIAPLSTKKVLCKWDVAKSRLIPTVTTGKAAEAETAQGPPPEKPDTAPLEELDSEDIDELENYVSVEDGCVQSDNAEICSKQNSTGELLTREQVLFLSTEMKAVVKRPELLKSVTDVEQAIRHEKYAALVRYKATIRKIKGLELILRRMKGTANNETKSSSLPVQHPYILPPTPVQQPFIPSPVRPRIVSEYDLPLPLFDDYN